MRVKALMTPIFACTQERRAAEDRSRGMTTIAAVVPEAAVEQLPTSL